MALQKDTGDPDQKDTGDPEYFLDFTKKGVLPQIPEWLPRTDLKLCIGYGDYVHDGIANTAFYPDYDVYLIYTGYLKNNEHLDIPANIAAIQKSNNPKRVICNVDLYDFSQVYNFTKLFLKRMKLIEHRSNGPTIPPFAAVALLRNEGILRSAPYRDHHKLVKFSEPNFVATEAKNTFIFHEPRDMDGMEWADAEKIVRDTELAEELELAQQNQEREREWRKEHQTRTQMRQSNGGKSKRSKLRKANKRSTKRRRFLFV